MNIPDWILGHGDSLQIALFFSLLPVLALMERITPRRAGSLKRGIRWPTNLLLTFFNLVALGIVPVSLLTAAYWAQQHGWGLLNRTTLPIGALVVLNLLVRGFISFFTHYLMHHVPMFWRVHRVHHLDTELDVTTTVRFHPLEFFVQVLPGLPIVVVAGLTPWVLVLYEIIDVVVTLWTHSNLRVPIWLDRWLHYVVVTPDVHRIHHSARMPETNSNFGAVFPIWDLVFRTFRAIPRDGHDEMRIGLDEVRGRDAHRPLWLLGSIFRASLVARAVMPKDAVGVRR
jgi:sterol desaturase/sphingolipid hydroxylase (fatty acid hydroxylase superfamily)